MGKQTRMSGSQFGGKWTREKLYIIEQYLESYSTILKYQKVRKIYIDGFAGSGKTELKNETKIDAQEGLFHNEVQEKPVIDGSALISLKYNFDEYYFLEIDPDRIETLKRNIVSSYPEKMSKVHFLLGDSNEKLYELMGKITCYDRCLMFLDPYSLELKWNTLEQISKCGVVDLWYLFPINSLSRLLPKDGKVDSRNKQLITDILGTSNWEYTLYTENLQMNIFGEIEYDRIEWDEFVNFIIKRFGELFHYVSPDTKILRNTKKQAPMFLLCFMMTNPSPKAVAAASRVVQSIITKTEKIQ